MIKIRDYEYRNQTHEKKYFPGTGDSCYCYYLAFREY